jgi:hypothetical protein
MLRRIVGAALSGLRLARNIAAVLCVGAVLTGVPATPALASKVCGFDYAQNWTCTGSDSFTALAVSDSTWNWGASWRANSRAQAENIALAQCRARASDCHVQLWGANVCLAWATSDSDRIWGADYDLYVDTAMAKALNQCKRAGGKHCVVHAHPCADDD